MEFHSGERLPLAVAICFAFWLGPTYGQCPPPPVLPEDGEARSGPLLKKVLPGDGSAQSDPSVNLESDQNDAAGDSLHGKAHLEEVIVEAAGDLQDSIKAGIDDRLERWGSEINSNTVDALAEGVKEVLQNSGYFHASVSAETSVLNVDEAEEQVSLRFRVSQGQKYRLEEIQFANAHVFPAWELRNQFPLRDGDVFNLGKIREGLEASRKLYNSAGYINFVATPDLRIDNTHQRISVTFETEEGDQFRVSSIEILGLDPENSNTLVIKLKPGDIFRQNLIEQFYKDNESAIPGDASRRKNTEINQDPKNRMAAVVFDFRGCQNPPLSTH